jgi:hypothetical protein
MQGEAYLTGLRVVSALAGGPNEVCATTRPGPPAMRSTACWPKTRGRDFRSEVALPLPAKPLAQGARDMVRACHGRMSPAVSGAMLRAGTT